MIVQLCGCFIQVRDLNNFRDKIIEFTAVLGIQNNFITWFQMVYLDKNTFPSIPTPIVIVANQNDIPAASWVSRSECLANQIKTAAGSKEGVSVILNLTVIVPVLSKWDDRSLNIYAGNHQSDHRAGGDGSGRGSGSGSRSRCRCVWIVNQGEEDIFRSGFGSSD